MPDEILSEDARKREAGRQLAQAIFDDPELGPQYRQLIAKKFPNAKSHMPDVLAREAGSALLNETRKVIESDKAERERERSERYWESEREGIMRDPELLIRKEEMPEVERLMKEELIGSHRTAARLLRATQALAAAAPSADPGDMELQVPGRKGAGGDQFKGILEDRDEWSKRMTHKMIADFRAGKGDRWL